MPTLSAGDEATLAAEGGLPAICHAGETEGPQSIRKTIDLLKSIRIGHGVRCFEDPALVAELRDTQTHLEVCPSSNICLKIFPNYENHPLPRMIEAGLNISINSDDPPMFNTTLANELRICHENFGLTMGQLWQLQVNAARNSLCTLARKAAIESHINASV